MPRIIAIDYGLQRVGLAVTDNFKMLATSLTTLPPGKIIPFLLEYTSKEEVECFVVGQPLHLDNSMNPIEDNIHAFIVDLKKNFPGIKIDRMDERFTSKMAHQAIRDAGIKKMNRRNKSLVDKVSATIILQNYLELHSK